MYIRMGELERERVRGQTKMQGSRERVCETQSGRKYEVSVFVNGVMWMMLQWRGQRDGEW